LSNNSLLGVELAIPLRSIACRSGGALKICFANHLPINPGNVRSHFRFRYGFDRPQERFANRRNLPLIPLQLEGRSKPTRCFRGEL
jgi:hypothetical protein